jgi:hypothetical protein
MAPRRGPENTLRKYDRIKKGFGRARIEEAIV